MDSTLRLPPGYPRNFGPVSVENELPSLAITGSVPHALNGMLLRNGPNPLHDQGAGHWFEGDGMLHAFSFAGGHVSYRNRWIRTPRWLAAQLAPPGALPVDDAGSVANTNVLLHAGRLLALEEAHLPLRVQGANCAPAVPDDSGGALAAPFTAHPKIDPATGELVFFGYGTPDGLGNGMSWGRIDSAGIVQRFERFSAPCASMVHDFAVTGQHVLFPVMPLVGNLARATAGGPPFAWEPERGAFLGLMRRDAGVASLDWREAPLGHVFHVMNAWDDGRRVQIDLMHADVPALFTRPDGQPVAGDSDAYLTRWTFDLDRRSRGHSVERLCHIPGEFPRIDDRFAGTAHRHGWFVGDGASGEPFACLVHLDHTDGRLDVFALPPGDCASEAVFVPRSPEAAEADGWLLCVVYRGRTDLSDLLVFEAQHVGAGPIASVHVPCRVPNGFHGNWIDASTGWHADGHRPPTPD